MEHILPNVNLNLIAIFLWHVCFVYLIVQMTLSLIIYRNNRDKIFLIYFAYVTLLFTYIVCRNYYFLDLLTYLPVYLYSYLIQVIYLCVYFHFGLSLLNFRKYHPTVTKWIYRYLIMATAIGMVIFCATLMGLIHPSNMPNYYFSIFFPIHILIALYILFRVVSLKTEKQYTYFLIGSFAFLILGVLAVVSSRSETFLSVSTIRGISFFYAGIIVECTFFGIGLGIRVRDIYTGKLETERQLNAAQKELQTQMLQRIEQQEEDKIALQKEKELQVLATQVALLENKVLRSQMNSHFIFNVLNSIKAYIIEQDVPKAVTYLNKFSKLMRQVLDASRDEKHTLADELNAIKLYLAIEKMRISDNLSVEINIDIGQPLETVHFPPLLMQPFVENAIWHGLIPSNRAKELFINVFNVKTDILIDITDNGIGYSNSIREKKALNMHRSYGMNITRERIDQFNLKSKNTISFGIEDRKNAAGTKVWIRIDMG